MNANLISQITGVTVTLGDSQVIIDEAVKEDLNEILEAVFGNQTPKRQ